MSVTALFNVDSASLRDAREACHHAVQHVSRLARANLEAAADDSHSSLKWTGGAFESLDFGNGTRAGLHVSDLTLFTGDATLALPGKTESDVEQWLAGQATALGLRPAADAEMPYELEPYEAYSVSRDACEAMAAWYALADAGLQKLLDGQTGSFTPIRVWPHHFDIATLLQLEDGDPEEAKSVGIGLSPGDTAYDEPYFYVSPWPHLTADQVLATTIGHWHLDGFSAAILSASEIDQSRNAGEQVDQFLEDALRKGVSALGLSL